MLNDFALRLWTAWCGLEIHVDSMNSNMERNGKRRPNIFLHVEAIKLQKEKKNIGIKGVGDKWVISACSVTNTCDK